MKKLLFASATALALFGLAACSNDDMPAPGPQGGDGNVTLSLQLPQDLTRAYGNGLTATNLTYAVYEEGSKTPVLTAEVPNAFTNLNATLNLQLANGVTYDIVFWADAADAPYEFDASTQSITVDYTGVAINDESRDAFFNSVTIPVKGPVQQTVILKRPFAQINLGATDYSAAAVEPFVANLQTNLTTSSCSKLNLLTGEASEPTDVTFAAGAVPPATEQFPVTDPAGIRYLSMDYILVNADRTTQTASFGIYDGAKLLNTVNVDNMPVRRNYRTNIYGQVLTSNAELTIVINPIFDGEYNLTVPVWDGTTTEAPTQVDANTYELSKPEHLAYIAQQVNSGTTDYSGKTLRLTSDIDLDNQTWTPIGTADKPFKGTVDGQSHVIHNLYAKGDSSNGYIGLFGHTVGSTISNLEINNVHMTNTNTAADQGTGAVAGDPYTTSYSNIKVTGEVQITAQRYVGGVFGHNVYGNISDVTVDVSSDSYIKALSDSWGFLSAPNHVGGVAGYVGEGSTRLTNLTSNINVISYAPGVGGVVGTIQSGNILTNCSSSGNVTLYTNKYQNKALPALAIGGIAGDHVGAATFSGCSFTGTLASYLDSTLYTLPKVNQTVGIRYGGRTAGLSNSYTGITINGASVPADDMADI